MKTALGGTAHTLPWQQDMRDCKYECVKRKEKNSFVL